MDSVTEFLGSNLSVETVGVIIRISFGTIEILIFLLKNYVKQSKIIEI